jgi:uncharacterized membrane protein YgcG
VKKAHFVLFVVTIGTLLLSACGGAAATPNAGGVKVDALPVAFTGIVESMAGDQWVINGQTVTVDPAVVRDGPFKAGDRVKVEGVVNSDGSFSVSRVETPTSADLSTLPQFGDDNTNTSNSNDANVNDANINDGNMNEDNSNAANSNDANINDDNGTDLNSNAANVNDDNGNTSNANDDNGSPVNSNSNNTNDDNSSSGGNNNGGGGNDNGGGNDSGGGGNDNGGNSNGG